MSFARKNKTYRKDVREKKFIRLFIYFLFTFALLYFVSGQKSFVNRIGQIVTDISSPIQYVLSRPFVMASNLYKKFNNHINLYEKNEKLRVERDELLRWKQATITKNRRFQEYETLLELTLPPEYSFIAAHVSADMGGTFIRTFLINIGRYGKVGVGDFVVGSRALVGRVIATGVNSSRVLFLTDLSSRIPIRVENKDIQAIMRGNNTNYPVFEFMSGEQKISEGDKVFVARLQGLPSELFIGNVGIDEEGQAFIKLADDLNNLFLVRVVNNELALPPKDIQSYYGLLNRQKQT